MFAGRSTMQRISASCHCVRKVGVKITRNWVFCGRSSSLSRRSCRLSRRNFSECPWHPPEHPSPPRKVSNTFRAYFCKAPKFGADRLLELRVGSSSIDCLVRRAKAWLQCRSWVIWSAYSALLILNFSRLYSCLKRWMSLKWGC